MRFQSIAFSAFAGLCVTATVSGANAAPIQVAYGSITADSSEDFEGFAVSTALSSPFDFGDFTVTQVNPSVVVDSSIFCTDGSDACLVGRSGPALPRAFDDFALGTTFFGFELNQVNPTEVIEVAVTGLSGLFTFNISGDGFYAFGDATGLVSVVFTGLGVADPSGITSFGNYSFDEIILQIDDLSEIPLPAAFPLFLAGLAGLGFARRRNKKATT